MEDVEDRRPGRTVRGLTQALKFLAPYRWQVIGATVALVLTASVTLSIGQGIRLVIDRGFAANAPEVLISTIGVFALLVVLLTLGTYARYYLVSWIGERVSADLRNAAFRRLIRIHPGFFESNAPTEIQSRITTDTTILQTVIGSSVSVALRNLLMCLGGVVLLFVTNPKLSFIVVLAAPLVVLPIVLFGRRVRRLSRSSQDSVARIGSYVGEAFRNIKVVQAFSHEPTDLAQFSSRVEDAFRVAVHRIRERAWLIACVMLLVMAAIAVMLWIGGQDVLSGRTTPGELAAFIFYAFIVAGSVGAIGDVYGDLQRAAGATERLLELLAADSELTEPADPVALTSIAGHVALDDVVFRYPARPDAQVLAGLSLAARAGEMVALVGPSGAGKTTVLDLVQRFYDPLAGAVTLDGVDLRRLALADVRAAMAFVPQDPALFSGTLLDNVRYGHAEAPAAAVRRALASANALAFVEALPAGLETRIGEGGVGLSGGQRQRLAIARALLPEPRVLLVDEATSALDAESESLIREALEGLRGRCTLLVVAHRLSTVRRADRIYVLDAGAVVAGGTHAELLRDSDLYRRYAAVQQSAHGDPAEHRPDEMSLWGREPRGTSTP